MDTFDALAHKWLGASSPDSLADATAVPRSPFRRVIMFVDNAGRHLLSVTCSCDDRCRLSSCPLVLIQHTSPRASL